MQECKKCKITIRGNKKCCPLCQGRLNGEPEEPVRLGTAENINMFDELTVNMLEACGIPCLCLYPGDGSFGKLIFGISGQGTDIYVPKSMADDAAALCTYQGDYEM